MTNYFNDSPIKTEKDDRYGITPFTRSLAKSIRSIKAPEGTVIALNGPWGSGKSSAVSLIREELEKANDETFIISEFKCWWYRGEEALALAFLQNLHALLSDALKDKVKEFIPKLGRNLLQAGPVIGTAIAFTPAGPFAAITGASFKFAERFFPKGDTLEKTFKKLATVLEQEPRRFLIIIDDIDRLNPDEAIAIFRMVKSVGQLPNIMYLLVFDRELAENAVKEHYPSEGPHFLEKIIQAGFELPAPLRTDLNHAILSSIESICGSQDESDVKRIMNIFHDVVAPYLTTPRHVARFQNAISVTWPAIANEISLADFIALETLRLYEPALYQSIRSNKSSLCGMREYNGRSHNRDENKFSPFLIGVKEVNYHTSKLALQRLFPRLEETGYSVRIQASWDAQRRVCIDAHFDTYFRLSLSIETLEMSRINELIARIDDRKFILTTFREAAITIRRTGTSMIPVFLDELITHAPKVDKNKVEPLLAALFEIHDEIDMDMDKERGMMAKENTTLRYHWLIRRLTDGRFNIDERTALYMSAIQHASLGWLVDFVKSAKDDYHEHDGEPHREDECLTRGDAINELVDRALEVIRDSAKSGSLLHHKDLIYILYRWRDFLGNDPSEVRAWIDPLLNDDDALVIFAKELTGESWSQGLGLGMEGLGDRVSMRTIRANIDDNIEILDAAAFRVGLERLLRNDDLDNDSRTIIDEFLNAWKRQSVEDDE